MWSTMVSILPPLKSAIGMSNGRQQKNSYQCVITNVGSHHENWESMRNRITQDFIVIALLQHENAVLCLLFVKIVQRENILVHWFRNCVATFQSTQVARRIAPLLLKFDFNFIPHPIASKLSVSCFEAINLTFCIVVFLSWHDEVRLCNDTIFAEKSPFCRQITLVFFSVYQFKPYHNPFLDLMRDFSKKSPPEWKVGIV